MIEKVKEVFNKIENEIGLHKELLNLLNKEQGILVNLKFENLEENLISQLDLVEKIKIEEDERLKLVAELSEISDKDLEKMNIDEMLNMVEDEEEKGKLIYSRDQLRELLKDIKKINESNDFLIRNSLSFIEKNIKIMLEGTDKEQFYGDTNKRKKTAHGKVLDWKV